METFPQLKISPYSATIMAVWILHDFDALIAFVINKNVLPIGPVYSYLNINCVLSGLIPKKMYGADVMLFFRR